MPSARLIRVGTFTAAALCCQPALAAETSGYALTLERDSSALRIDDTAVATLRERVGITFEEAYPSRAILLELTLGQMFLTQSRFPTSAGTDATGYFLRVAGHQTLVASQPFGVVIHGAYQFEQADGPEPDADSIRLHGATAGIALHGALTPWINVGVRGDYGAVSGVEKTAQPARARRDVEGDERFGAQVLVDLNVESGGYVGFSAGTGFNRGFALYFARRLSN